MALTEPKGIPLFRLGFRPLFLLATIFSILAVTGWFFIYRYAHEHMPGAGMGSFAWHGHEMLFGYAFAVIAGFLLTAVRNWTGIQTVRGTPLLLLCCLWLGARIAVFISHPSAIQVMAVLDVLFGFILCFCIFKPIIKARQWRQTGIVLLVFLIATANLFFYLELVWGIKWLSASGLVSGMYLFVLLVMVMARRVIPFFIEKGVDSTVRINNPQWLDVTVIISMSLLLVFKTLWLSKPLAVTLAAVLFVLSAWRLYAWYTPGIWKKSLLWILYVAYTWLTVAFGMMVISDLGMTKYVNIELHAMTYGVIGLITIGMMARVTLGHTGRDVSNPPAILDTIFVILLLGSIVRVLVPLLFPKQFNLWMHLSQVLWIAGYTLFLIVFTPMLVRTRVDNRDG